MRKLGAGSGRWFGRGLAMGVMVLAVGVQVGCQERVVRQKAYYPGQFNHVTSAKAPTSAPRARQREDKGGNIFSDAWNGVTNLFSSDKDAGTERSVMSVEDLRQMQAKRAASENPPAKAQEQ